MPYDRAKLIAELERDEGRQLKPYVDTVGKLTIGCGRNLTDVGISEEECDFLLSNDISRKEKELDSYLSWWRGLDDVRQRVMLNLSFMGIANLLTFVNTLQAIKEGRWADAAAGILNSKYHQQVHGRAERLAQAMFTGVMP